MKGMAQLKFKASSCCLASHRGLCSFEILTLKMQYLTTDYKLARRLVNEMFNSNNLYSAVEQYMQNFLKFFTNLELRSVCVWGLPSWQRGLRSFSGINETQKIYDIEALADRTCIKHLSVFSLYLFQSAMESSPQFLDVYTSDTLYIQTWGRLFSCLKH